MNKLYKGFKVSIVAVSIIVSTTAYGVMLGYVTGNDYNKLSKAEKTAWVVGAVDGIIAESLLSTKENSSSWLGKCVSSMTGDQVKAIFEKELSANPEAWHAPAALLLRGRMLNVCKK